MLVLAWQYDALKAFERRQAPPCVKRFAADERDLVDQKLRQQSRLGLLLLGMLMTVRGMLSGPLPVWNLPPVLLSIWLLCGLLYLTVSEVLRSAISQ